MKKLIIFVLPFLLFSCFWESDEVKQAKQELLGENTQKENNNEIRNISLTWETINLQENIKEEQKSYYKINFLSSNKFIDIESIPNIENVTDSLDIKWIVNNPDIDKIVVNFENRDSSFPVDNYTLQTFKKADSSFLYRAYKKYQVLDNWLNKYTIDAYIWENLVSKIELEVFIASKNNSNSKIKTNQTWNNNSYIPKTIGWENDSVFLNLPIDEDNYWSPIMTSESSLTYSKISNFEIIKNSWIIEANCDNIWDYLSTKYTWYYWNTCRPIYENSFSVNVLTLTWDKYKYEKHYIDKKYNFYWIVLLEDGEWISKNDLQAKNNEFKIKTYDVIEKTDKLFKDLLK